MAMEVPPFDRQSQPRSIIGRRLRAAAATSAALGRGEMSGDKVGRTA